MRRSERNINSSVEYIDEYPDKDSESDMVTAPSEVESSEHEVEEKTKSGRKSKVSKVGLEKNLNIDSKTVVKGCTDCASKQTAILMKSEVIVTQSRTKGEKSASNSDGIGEHQVEESDSAEIKNVASDKTSSKEGTETGTPSTN